jgi:hypothetical protein
LGHSFRDGGEERALRPHDGVNAAVHQMAIRDGGATEKISSFACAKGM